MNLSWRCSILLLIVKVFELLYLCIYACYTHIGVHRLFISYIVFGVLCSFLMNSSKAILRKIFAQPICNCKSFVCTSYTATIYRNWIIVRFGYRACCCGQLVSSLPSCRIFSPGNLYIWIYDVICLKRNFLLSLKWIWAVLPNESGACLNRRNTTLE